MPAGAPRGIDEVVVAGVGSAPLGGGPMYLPGRLLLDFLPDPRCSNSRRASGAAAGGGKVGA